MSENQGPVVVPVPLTFSPNPSYSPGVQPFSGLITQYDGDVPTIAWDNPNVATVENLEIVQNTDTLNYFVNGEIVGLLPATDSSTANGTLTVDGVAWYVFAVTMTQNPPEQVSELTLGTYQPPAPPPAAPAGP